MQFSRFSQLFFTVIVVLTGLVIISHFMKGTVEEIKTSELEMYIQDGYVAEVNLIQSSSEARGKFKPGSQPAETLGTENFIAKYDLEQTDELIELMREHNVSYNSVTPSFWESMFSPSAILLFFVFLIPIVFLFWLMNRQMQGGGSNQAMNFGKSKARLASDGKRRVTFSEVAGVDEAVEELKEVVDFLRDPKKYEALGAEIPKGVLLVGPPGCGKTHLAKAVAGEANVPFFYISGSDFVEMFVGVGASRVRDLFDQAKRRAPCLVFIDELDAVGRHRGTGIGGTHDEREQTLNQMLVEMDGFEPNSGIIVLAATNRPDVLDPALLRPGRFDRRIVVDSPDLGGREGILNIYSKNKPIAEDVDLEELAKRTPGFSGADLKNTINEAALLAARTGAKRITAEHMYEAVDRVVAGPERKSRIINDKEKRILAYHELGHAVVSHELLDTDPVHKVSVLPRGQALGYTLMFPEEDRFLVSRQQILDRVSVALGGRAAEKLVFGETYTGAQNDLERSTQMVRALITKYGMSDELGPVQFGNQHENPFLGRSMMEDRNYSDEIAYRIDQETKRIMTECYERAKEILTRTRRKLDYMAEILIRQEHLDRKEFEELMGKEPPEDWTAKDFTNLQPGDDAPASKFPNPAQRGGDPDTAPAPAG